MGMNILLRKLRIMRISNYFGISLYKLTRNWITIALTSCLWTNRTRIASSLTFACPGDRRVDIKQEEKVNKYLDLAIEIQELWKMKRVKVVPLL